MSKPSPKRLGLLRMIQNHNSSGVAYVSAENGDTYTMDKYGLTPWDISIQVTCAVKAGLIEPDGGLPFVRLTDEGKALLEKYDGVG